MLSSNDQRRLYGDLAWVWPIVSPPEYYVDESEFFCNIIKKTTQGRAKELLNLGCGGGHNDNTLKKHFEVNGVDISENMLGLARRLNPEVTYLVGDICKVRLKKRFDAVTIFDSVVFMLNEDDLRALFKTAFVHLKPGGIFLTFQVNNPEQFKQNGHRYSVHRQGDIEIALVENVYDPDPEDTTYELTYVYLIRRAGRLKIETDRHLVGNFRLETIVALLKEAGFDVETSGKSIKGCPVFICVKPF